MNNVFLGYPSQEIINWIKGHAGKRNFLCFTAKTVNSSVKLQNVAGEYQTSSDGKNWTDYTLGTTVNLPNAGDKVYFKAKTANTTCWNNLYGSKFVMTGKIAASGNIQSLLNENMERTDVPQYCYSNMFSNCTSLTNAPELPARTLAKYCYSNMFQNCTSLIQAPELPARTLTKYCYSSMFQNCTSLIQAPELLATSLADGCYSNMFSNCTSLIQAPELLATSLADGCYSNMFFNCTSLIQAPALPATSLADGCYSNMFFNCTSLIQAPALPATSLADGCYHYMFYNCMNIETLNIPNKVELTDMYSYDFVRDCQNLKRINAPKLLDMYNTIFSTNKKIQYVDVHESMTADFVIKRAPHWPLPKGCIVYCKDGIVIIGEKTAGSGDSSASSN